MKDCRCVLLILAVAICVMPRGLGHGDVHDLIASLTQQISAKPSAELLLRRGQMYRVHGDIAAAAADFDAAEKLDRGLAEVDLARGEMLSEMGKHGEAKAVLDRFVEKRPQHPGGYVARARVRSREGANLAAAGDFATACTLLPDADPSLFLEHARSLQQAGRVEDALRVLDNAIARRGMLVVLMQGALEMEETAGLTEQALSRLDKLIAASPRKERWLARKGALLEKDIRPEEARVCFLEARTALESVPETRRNSTAMVELAKNLEVALQRLPAYRAP